MIPSYTHSTNPTTQPTYPDLDMLDKLVAPGLRLWMLLGLIGTVLLFMIIVTCCFMKIRIPRTKREIELMAARRRIRKRKGHLPAQDISEELEHGDKNVIVMQSLGVPTASDAGSTSASCTSLNEEKHSSDQSHSTAKEPSPAIEDNSTVTTRLLSVPKR